MKFKKTLAAASGLLALALITFTGGCAGPSKSLTPSEQASAVTQTYGTPEKPADQTVKAEPADNKQAPVIKPQLGPAPAQGKTPEDREKVVYLTFDDGPNSFFTGRVLDILAEKGVKATFMVVGNNVEKNPDLVKRMLAEGHGLANHTYTHDYNIVYRSPEAFTDDLDKNNKVLIPYTSEPVMVFRAPGGPQKLDQSYKERLRARGYISVGWNITSADSDPHGVTPEQEYNNIVRDLERVERLKKSPIVLMHDGTQLASIEARPGTPQAAYIQNRESTIKALPAVIDLFKSRGYRFAVVDEHTPPAW